MASRFERGITYQAPLQWHVPEFYTPNFEAWGSVLAANQQSFDKTNAALDAMKPPSLYSDAVNEYHQRWQGKADELVDIYTNQGVDAGNKHKNKLLRDVKNEIVNPNSEYNTHKSIYDKYHSEVNRLNEFHEKDPVKDNLQHSMHGLTSQLGKTFDEYFDSETGRTSKQLNSVQATPFVDIQKDWISYIKGVQVDGKEVMTLGNKLIYTSSREEVPEARRKELFNAFISDPKYQGQIDVNTFTTTQGVDPVTFAARSNDNITKAVESLDTAVSTIEDDLNSGDKDKIEAAQEKLAQLGLYPAKAVDGKTGPKSAKALQDFKDQVDRRKNVLNNDLIDNPEAFSEEDLKKAGKKAVIDNYKNEFLSMFGSKQSDTFKFRDDYLINLRHSNKLKQQDDYFAKLTGYETTTPTLSLTTDKSVKITKNLQDISNENSEIVKASDNRLSEYSKDMTSIAPAINNSSKLETAAGAFLESRNEDGSVNKEKFAEILASRGISTDDVDMDQLTDTMLKNIDSYSAAIVSKTNALDKQKQADTYLNSAMRKYTESTGKANFAKFKRDNNLENLTDDEAFKVLEDAQAAYAKRWNNRAARPVRGVDPLNNKETLGAKYNTYRKQEADNIDADVINNPDLYKEVVVNRLVSSEKSPLDLATDMVVKSYNNGAGTGFTGINSYNLEWETANGNKVKTIPGKITSATITDNSKLVLTSKDNNGNIIRATSEIPEGLKDEIKVSSLAQLNILENDGTGSAEAKAAAASVYHSLSTNMEDVLIDNGITNAVLDNENSGQVTVTINGNTPITLDKASTNKVKSFKFTNSDRSIDLGLTQMEDVNGNQNNFILTATEYDAEGNITANNVLMKADASGNLTRATSLAEAKFNDVHDFTKVINITKARSSDEVRRKVESIAKKDLPLEQAINADNIFNISGFEQ